MESFILKTMEYTVRQLAECNDEVFERITYLLEQLNPGGNQNVTVDNLNALTKGDHSLALVAVKDDVICGLLCMCILTVPDGLNAWIEILVIDEPHRGRGLGKKLMGEAMRVAKERGCTSMTLTSMIKRIEANYLYPKLGFKRVETNFYRRSL